MTADPIASPTRTPAPARAPSGSHVAAQRRSELGTFLRSRRERLTPEQVGMPPGGRRRTPGLRREEVAVLSGVGVTWYTWLEQGRPINASTQVLESVARTMQFDVHERSHLFALAGMFDPDEEVRCHTMTPALKDLLHHLDPYPALVLNARYDILGYNQAYNGCVGGHLDDLAASDRNVLWLIFNDPAYMKVHIDPDARCYLVANLRANMAGHAGEHPWRFLLERLLSGSPDFREVWERHEVLATSSKTKNLLHPRHGPIHLTTTSLWIDRHVGTRLVTYTPADDETRALVLG